MVAEGVVRVFHDFSGLLMVFEVCSFVFFHGFKDWSLFLKVLHVFFQRLFRIVWFSRFLKRFKKFRGVFTVFSQFSKVVHGL